ncbi:MAG: hypothetical protein ISQ14_05685, partial [Verrucomicrobiae bacterium]|nr:hypothetical protein [Verrucomicrobiae bacterium]
MNARQKTDAGFALVIATIVFVVFSRTLGGDFLNWDDPVNVTKNPLIRSLAPDNLKAIFGDFQTAARYKPLSWLGWAIIHGLYGLEPGGYHFANVALHTLNCALLFFIFLSLGRRVSPDAKQASSLRIAAAVSALFWAVHPLRVEPV